MTVVVLTTLGVVVGSLEGRGEGLAEALILGVLRAPTLLVSVLPAVVAVGAGLGAARAEERGERLSLASAGVSAAASGRGPLLVGLVCGLLGFGVHTGLVPVLEAVADRLAPHPTLPWVWLEGAAVHTEQGFLLPVEGGRLGEPVRPQRVACGRP